MKDLEEIRRLKSEVLYIWGNGSYSRDIRDYQRTVSHYEGQIFYLVDDEYYQPGQENVLPLSKLYSKGIKMSCGKTRCLSVRI